MTHAVDSDGVGVVVAGEGGKNEGNDPIGDYVRLEENDELEDGIRGSHICRVLVEDPATSSSSSDGPMFCGCCTNNSSCFMSMSWWAKLILLILLFGVLAVVSLKWVGPFIMNKVIIPAINWETKTFSRSELAILVFASVSIFPTLFLPSSPSMWVAGMTFGYGYGFLLIIGAAVIGVSLPYFIGSLFHRKIQGLLERYPKRASVIRLAGEGTWFNQLRAVALIRISPFPYIFYNYCAVATDVGYIPYLFGSLIGMVPEIFLTIYTGIIIKTLADASQDCRFMSAQQIVFNLIGFCATMSATALVTCYARRRLQQLQKEEEVLLR